MEYYDHNKRKLYSGHEDWCMGPTHILLRLLSLFASLGATIIMVLSKEVAIVQVVLSPGLPPVPVAVPAQYNYSSAFVYFAVANAIACTYTSIALITGSVMKAAGSKRFMLALSILDLIMVVLVGAGSGAATAIGLVGLRGNTHLRWNKVCNYFPRFCTQVTAAIGVSMVGIFAFLFLVVVSNFAFYKRST